jgi:hypothetical protein
VFSRRSRAVKELPFLPREEKKNDDRGGIIRCGSARREIDDAADAGLARSVLLRGCCLMIPFFAPVISD